MQPKPLAHFKDRILASPEIQEFLAQHYGNDKDAALARFQAGDADELWDLIEDHKHHSLGDFASSLMAAAPDDDVFEIEILATGPVFWIRANEFDDIGYFETRQEALRYAEDFFEPYISELENREEE